MSDRQSTLASCSIDPPQSIPVPWTKFPRNPLLNALTSLQGKGYRRQWSRPVLEESLDGWDSCWTLQGSRSCCPSYLPCHPCQYLGERKQSQTVQGYHNSLALQKKGSKADCGNYQSISLLLIARKVLAQIILNSLITNIAKENLQETQCGFLPGCRKIDMIFTVDKSMRNALSKTWILTLSIQCIDMTKAFDTVNRKATWVILSKLGCTNKFVNLIHLFHDDINGLVLSDGKASEQFNTTNSVMQGCIFAPVLFNFFLTCDLNHAIRDFKQGVYRKGPCLTYTAWGPKPRPSRGLSLNHSSLTIAP